MFNCFGCMKQLVWGDGFDNAPTEIKQQPAVELDPANIGKDRNVI